MCDLTHIQDMTDQELADARKALPKYRNDCTPEQDTLSMALYQEQKRRFDAAKKVNEEEYNRKVEAADYHVGDRVSYFARSMIGFGGILVHGTVAKRSKYYVKLDVPFNGHKTAHLTKAWVKEGV